MTVEITPSQLSGASFRTVRKGYDPDEVDTLLRDAAAALEQAQQQATAMEARARAAVARLQEQSERAPAASEQSSPADSGDLTVGPDQAETISRTLLLAQRTADTTIAEAEAAAERIRAEARDEADKTLDSTKEMSAQLVEEARAEARKANETERIAAADEVESLKARREFLLGDVDQLEAFLVDQRDRLRGAARQIEALCERVPSGLGEVAAPVLSASDDDPGGDTGELLVPLDARLPVRDVDQLATALGDGSLSAGGPDTGELDATQPVTVADAPERPVRGEADSRTGGADSNGTLSADDDPASI
jgi:DivIVA domain-containing protein